MGADNTFGEENFNPYKIMKQLIKESNIIEKTIKRVEYYWEKLFIFFDDETFCIFEADSNGPVIEFVNQAYDTTPTDNNLERLRGLTLITEQEYDRLKAEQKLRFDAIQRLQELAKLAELKAKYNQ